MREVATEDKDLILKKYRNYFSKEDNFGSNEIKKKIINTCILNHEG